MTPARCRKVKGRGDEPRTEAPVNGGRNYRQLTAVVPRTNLAMCWKTRSISRYSPYTQGSDNPRSAGNQQERFESMLDVAAIPQAIGYYLAGFADGEGSFNVSFRPRTDYVFPWKVSLCFNVSQRERAILEVLQAHLGCGTMRQRADGVWYFEVNTLVDIIQNVIPFFERFGFLSTKKQRDFAKFVELAGLLRSGQHLTQQGVVEVLRIRLDMNDGGKRRYLDEDILRRFENPQRPHARRPRTRTMIWSDLHGDMQSTTEMLVPLPLPEQE